MQNKNFILFIALSLLIVAAWIQVSETFWPRKRVAKAPVDGEGKTEVVKGLPGEAAAKAIAGPWAELKKAAPPAPRPQPVVATAAPAPPTPPDKLITLGDADANSLFHLKV